jgi:hypothetical protein
MRRSAVESKDPGLRRKARRAINRLQGLDDDDGDPIG